MLNLIKRRKTFLHLGCGKRYLKGYIHIDLNNYPHIDYNHNIITLPMFNDNSVDLIYASHVIEYFDRAEIVNILEEWYRVLKTNGILRLAVPDFEALLLVYKKYKDLNKILGPLYGKWKTNTAFIYHKTAYDFISLSKLLASLRFKDIRKWDWNKVFIGKLKYFDDYSKAYVPHLDFENGVHISLNIEAIK